MHGRWPAGGELAEDIVSMEEANGVECDMTADAHPDSSERSSVQQEMTSCVESRGNHLYVHFSGRRTLGSMFAVVISSSCRRIDSGRSTSSVTSMSCCT